MQQKLAKIRSVIVLSACIGVIAFSFHQDKQIQLERQYEPCGGAPEFLEERTREDRTRDLTGKVIPGIIVIGAIADFVTANRKNHKGKEEKTCKNSVNS